MEIIGGFIGIIGGIIFLLRQQNFIDIYVRNFMENDSELKYEETYLFMKIFANFFGLSLIGIGLMLFFSI